MQRLSAKGGLQSHLRPLISVLLLECIVLLKCNCTIILFLNVAWYPCKRATSGNKSPCPKIKLHVGAPFLSSVYACCWKISIPSAPNASIRHAATYQPLELRLYLTMHIIYFTVNSFHSHGGFNLGCFFYTVSLTLCLFLEILLTFLEWYAHFSGNGLGCPLKNIIYLLKKIWGVWVQFQYVWCHHAYTNPGFGGNLLV